MALLAKRQSRGSIPSSANVFNSGDDFFLDCKAAYLSVIDDVNEDIESRSLLITVLQQAGRNPTSKVIDKYWTSDTDSIDFSAFCDICKKEVATTTDDLMKAFRKIDLNGDGYLSLEELYKVMTSKGEKMSISEVKAIIEDVDENKDGRLDYKEFSKMVITTADECKRVSRKVMERKERRKPRQSLAKPEPSARARRVSNGSINQQLQHADEKKIEGALTSMANAPLADKLGSHTSLQSRHSIRSMSNGSISQQLQQADERKTEEALTSTANALLADKLGSHTSLQSRHSIRSMSELEPPKPSPRKGSDERHKSSLYRSGKWPEPRNLKEWWHKSYRGTFFLADDDKSIINHWYSFRLPEDSSVWITIQPSKKIYQGSNEVIVDTMLCVLKNKGRDGYSLVASTEQQDGKGKYGVSCDLTAGVYTLAPFTTGCHLRARKKEPNTEIKLTRKDKDGNTSITKAFKLVLEDIFQMSDLDCNGLLSREELSLFNTRTSNEGVLDDEWEVVKEHVEMKSGEITKSGFVRLNEMEAEDPVSEKEDLWVTLSSMGFNRALQLDEACPFLMDVFAEECTSAVLRVKGLFEAGMTGGPELDKFICQSVVNKGCGIKVKGLKDVLVHTYQSDHNSTVVLENKTSQSVEVKLDCSDSRNCISNTDSLVQKVNAPAGNSVIVMHLLPRTEGKDWSVSCTHTVIK